MNIYIGNLSPEVSEEDLRAAFDPFGQITSVKVIKDRFTGEPRGFGFIEMPERVEANTAMENLNGTVLKGKTILVKEARRQSIQSLSDKGRKDGRYQRR